MIPQKILIFAGLLVLLTLLFPPFISVHPAGGYKNAGYGFIFSPPEFHWGAAVVHTGMLLTEWLAIVLLSGIWWMIERTAHFTKNSQEEAAILSGETFMDNQTSKTATILLYLLLRFSMFVISAVAVFFLILSVDLILIPLSIERLTGISFPPDYAPRISLPAIFVNFLSVIALFRKIVLKKSVKSLLIAITYFCFCQLLAFCLIVAGEPELAPPFGWIGLLGILGYYLIIKPFKNKPQYDEDEDVQPEFENYSKGGII
jgi:hypothetical protein